MLGRRSSIHIEPLARVEGPLQFGTEARPDVCIPPKESAEIHAQLVMDARV